MNIAHHMARAGHAYGERPAVAKGDAVLHTYASLAQRVERLAGGIAGGLGLAPGDRVALTMGNCPEYLEILYACWQAGLVVVPINAKLHASEFAYILENAGVRLCFATPDLAATVGSLGGLERCIAVPDPEYEALLTSEPLEVVPRGPGDTAWLFYTSGTTGRPKGATLTHRNLLAMCFCYFADVDPGAPWSAIIHAAPMSHGSGLYSLAHVAQASCHVIPEGGGFDAEEVYALIRRWPGVSMFVAPTMVKRLLDHPRDEDTANLKTLIYGGGPMYVEDCLAGLDLFGPKLSQLYGQGESPMTITALSAELHAASDHPRRLERLASVGVPQSVVEVQVADGDDRPVPAGELGEILVRGDSVMSGYWGDPEATAATLRGGWLHTGDLGVFDEDGFLTLKDRSKDVIISGGANIYPREVEEVLLRHPVVAETSVIGRPDREWGEVVVAYVAPAVERTVDPAELDEFCLQHLARFKRPRDYRFIDQIPKNNYGKPLKTALRELDRETAQPAGHADGNIGGSSSG